MDAGSVGRLPDLHQKRCAPRSYKMKAVYKSDVPYLEDEMNLPVDDLDAAIPFYERVMGFKVVPTGSATAWESANSNELVPVVRTLTASRRDHMARSMPGHVAVYQLAALPVERSIDRGQH